MDNKLEQIEEKIMADPNFDKVASLSLQELYEEFKDMHRSVGSTIPLKMEDVQYTYNLYQILKQRKEEAAKIGN